jgi:large subunit ribosomal protein L31
MTLAWGLREDITAIWHSHSIEGTFTPIHFEAMKPEIHPDYQFVVFEDSSADYRFLTRSTLKTDPAKTVVWEDGNTYPLVQLEISNASHPFFTGQMKIIDSAGRVDRFNKRYGARKKTVAKKAPAAKK